MAASHWQLTTRPWVLTWFSFTKKDGKKNSWSQESCTLCAACHRARLTYSCFCKAAKRDTPPTAQRPVDDLDRLHGQFCLLRYATATLLCFLGSNLTRPHRFFVLAMHTIFLNTFAPVTPKSIEWRRRSLYFVCLCMAMFTW
jgi:hypothetical protein